MLVVRMGHLLLDGVFDEEKYERGMIKLLRKPPDEEDEEVRLGTGTRAGGGGQGEGPHGLRGVQLHPDDRGGVAGDGGGVGGGGPSPLLLQVPPTDLMLADLGLNPPLLRDIMGGRKKLIGRR